jgi:hypothetical protein
LSRLRAETAVIVDRAAAAAREQVGLPLDDLHDAGANGAEPGDAKADGCGHGSLRRMVSCVGPC